MTDKLKVVAAIREALEAINAPIGNMVDRQEAVIRTLNARFAWQAICNPEAITTVLAHIDETAAERDAALERVKVLEADAERLDVLEAATQRDGWIVAKNVGSFTASLGRRQHATRATLRAAIDAAATADKGER